MRAFIPVIFLVAASCASHPQRLGDRIILGRIVSTPAVELWAGHVTVGDAVIYEVAYNNTRNQVTGIIPTSAARCPYNSRPGEQLFRIEYVTDGYLVVYDDSVPRHLRTANMVMRCDQVPPRDAEHD